MTGHHVPKFDVGDWALYDIDYLQYRDLAQIIALLTDYYLIELITDKGKRYPGITIRMDEFDKHALRITEEDAMILILERGIQ